MNRGLKIGLIIGTLGVASFIIYRRIKNTDVSESALKKRIGGLNSGSIDGDLESEIQAKTLSNALADNGLSKNEVNKYITIMGKAKSKDYKPSKEEIDFLNSFSEKIKKYRNIKIADLKIDYDPTKLGAKAIFNLYGVKEPISLDLSDLPKSYIISDILGSKVYDKESQSLKNKWKGYTIEKLETGNQIQYMLRKNGVTLLSWYIDSKTKQII